MTEQDKNSSSEMGVEQLEPASPSRLQGPEFPYDNPQVRYISNSELQTFKDCPRKWWLAYYRGLTLKNQKFIGPLAIGNRIHRALEAWYVPDGHTRTNPCDALERCITDDWSKVVQSHRDSGGEITMEFTTKFKKESDLERIMLEGYMNWIEETGADSHIKVIAPEMYIEVPFSSKFLKQRHDEKETRLIGRVDVQIERETDGRQMFIDHKTVADLIGPTVMLPVDEQMLMYMFLQRNDETEARKCAGALYNMLKKVRRSGTAKPPFFNRVEVYHNKHQLESFEMHMIATVDGIQRAERSLDKGAGHQRVVYPRPTRDCTWKCDFQQVCGMFDDGSRAEAMLDAFYTVDNPIRYYDKNDIKAQQEA